MDDEDEEKNPLGSVDAFAGSVAHPTQLASGHGAIVVMKKRERAVKPETSPAWIVFKKLHRTLTVFYL